MKDGAVAANTVNYEEGGDHNVMSPPRDTLSFGFKGAPIPRHHNNNLKGLSNSN